MSNSAGWLDRCRKRYAVLKPLREWMPEPGWYPAFDPSDDEETFAGNDDAMREITRELADITLARLPRIQEVDYPDRWASDGEEN